MTGFALTREVLAGGTKRIGKKLESLLPHFSTLDAQIDSHQIVAPKSVLKLKLDNG